MIANPRIALAAALLVFPLAAQTTDIKTAFLNPAPDTRPGCYWYWINDNVGKEGITKDLEAMARVGIGRAYIGHIFGQGERWETPVGKVPFMGDAWWDAVQWAVKEAGRVGVEIGFFNSPGWSQSGGPWIKPSQSMRYLDASETIIEGGKRIDRMLPVPEIKTFPMAGGSKPEATGPKFTAKDFQDVRVIAFLQPETEIHDIEMANVKVTSPTIRSLSKPFKIRPKIQHIDFQLAGLPPVRSLRIDPVDHLYILTCVVAVSDDGNQYREIVKHVEQRGHQGPRNKDPILVPFPETNARHLRVTLSASREIPIAGLALSRRAVVAHHVRKQLGETSPSVRPPWDSYIWADQPAPAEDSTVHSSSSVDLTDKMDRNGRLVWDAPPGRWVVMRAGMVPIGTQCAPASPLGRGLEVDKMSKEHIRALFDGMVGEFLRRTPPEERKALKYVIADSYETGPQNWTDGMVEKFERRFGYSPARFMPCLTGRVVDTPEITTRFLWDWRRLIAESIATDYVGGLREVAHEHGLTLWLENYGHWGFPSEFLLYGSMSDQIGGEFWEDGDPRDSVECRAASSAARIYGMLDCYAEAFTSSRSFVQSPASMKSWLDWVYGAGINHPILHVYIHQPDERKPGINAWFGTAFNRHNTWFEPGKAFIDYMRRSAVLLKAGRPVVDVAYHIGEAVPAMEGPRSPALPDGHDFDYINSDVLIHRAKVVDGRITVPDGPSYAVLVLPGQTAMRPEVASAIQRLIRDGAHVIGAKPLASPSLAGFPDCDTQLKTIADEVWGVDFDPDKPSSRAYGKGMIHHRVGIAEVLEKTGLRPDVLLEGDGKFRCHAAGDGKNIGIGGHGGIVFHHRGTPEREIYFLANTSDREAEITASLRVGGRRPELWNAVTGKITSARGFTQRDGRTLVPLRLAPSESVFVVLGGKIGPEVSSDAESHPPESTTIATLDGPWTVRFDGQGAPAETVFDKPIDWSRHADDAIKHYSGTAVYETRFTLQDAADRSTILELGETGVLATVHLNDREVGTVWTAPWEIDISGHVKAGSNKLRIHVTNNWHNRLIGDAALPPERRFTHTSQPHRLKPVGPPQKSGLAGPVVIKQARHGSP